MKTEEKLKELKELTVVMLECREQSAQKAEVRRNLMFELNRQHGVTYIELAEACGLNPARIAQEMAREIRDRKNGQVLKKLSKNS